MADSIGMCCIPSLALLPLHPFFFSKYKISLGRADTNTMVVADRVFVHALNTVKKIPKTGASRPPNSDRLRLYGLYKQAMEGDVDGVMERPLSVAEGEDGYEEAKKDRDKYDTWDAQRGLSRTEAKKRYIEALIETMHKYASTTAYVLSHPIFASAGGKRLISAQRCKSIGR